MVTILKDLWEMKQKNLFKILLKGSENLSLPNAKLVFQVQ